jgi:hypothetical protein
LNQSPGSVLYPSIYWRLSNMLTLLIVAGLVGVVPMVLIAVVMELAARHAKT